jgi:YidC/Oxa1 family membrane protein insertase
MFTTLIVQPIFNLLVLIYALLPGHNFGLAIILFTIAVRLLMWPLVKKQLHQVKLMRHIQPELKRIKQAAAGNKQKESMLMLELYKERGISPFGQIGIVIVQLPILLGLYSGLQRVLKDPHELVSFSYPALQHLSWLKQLGSNVHLFDNTLFHFIDLTCPALGVKGLYWPALMLVIGSAIIQFFQSQQLTPNVKESRGIRNILRDAKTGKQTDQSELNAAMSRNLRYILPVMVLFFTVRIASALSLYWLVSGIVAYIQQAILLREDVTEMEAATDKATPKKDTEIIEGEVVKAPEKTKAPTTASAKKQPERKKRRKK